MERYVSHYSSPSYGYIVGQIGPFNLGTATGLGEGRFWIPASAKKKTNKKQIHHCVVHRGCMYKLEHQKQVRLGSINIAILVSVSALVVAVIFTSSTSKMRHQANFSALYCWYEFRIFFFQDRCMYQRQKTQLALLFTHKWVPSDKRDGFMPFAIIPSRRCPC